MHLAVRRSPHTLYSRPAQFDFRYWVAEGAKAVGGGCNAEFGAGLLERWRNTRLEWCADPASAAAPGGGVLGTLLGRALLEAEEAVEAGQAAGEKPKLAPAGVRPGKAPGPTPARGGPAAVRPKAAASQPVPKLAGKLDSRAPPTTAAAASAAASAAGPSAGAGNASRPRVSSSISLFPYNDKGKPVMFGAARFTVLDSQ